MTFGFYHQNETSSVQQLHRKKANSLETCKPLHIKTK